MPQTIVRASPSNASGPTAAPTTTGTSAPAPRSGESQRTSSSRSLRRVMSLGSLRISGTAEPVQSSISALTFSTVRTTRTGFRSSRARTFGQRTRSGSSPSTCPRETHPLDS